MPDTEKNNLQTMSKQVVISISDFVDQLDRKLLQKY
jgi:hypothetical protein